ncbi:TniQ family protein [Paraburkholderia strydomiana]|uniref:TniQ family protein n=1 Tax=Paraburkholderia strydomiana TaxID=1245417 RepID=UPI0038B74534
MSRLFPLKPVNGFKWDRERLWSFVLRLAEHHSVTVGDLVTKVIWPESGWPVNKRRMLFGFEYCGQLDGAGQVARDWATVLNSLTRRDDLQMLTLLPLSGAIRFKGECRSSGARCIECLREAVETNAPVYEPLCWALNEYTVCVKHGVKLTDSCAACGARDIAVLRHGSRVGCCGKCGAWMGGPAFQSFPPAGHSRLKLASSECISELFKLVGEPRLNEADGTATLRYAIAFAFASNQSELARAIGIGESTLSCALANGTKPSLSQFVRLSLASGIPPRRLLLGSKEMRRTPASQLRERVELAVRTSPRHARFDKRLLKSALGRALHRKTPVALSTIASSLGTDDAVLRHHFPDLSAEVVARFAAARRTRAAARYSRGCDDILTAVNSCMMAGKPPTVRRIVELIGPIILEAKFRAFYRQTLVDYGLRDE